MINFIFSLILSYFSFDEFFKYYMLNKSKFYKTFDHKLRVHIWFWFNRRRYRLFNLYLTQGMSHKFAYNKALKKDER